MANHKSAIKRDRQSQARRARNRANSSAMKTTIKAIHAAIDEAKSVDEVQKALRAAIPVIHRTAVKGTIHKRNASRKVSRLTKRVNALVKGAQPAA